MDDCQETRKKILNMHLGFLEEAEKAAVGKHLEGCGECREASDRILADFEGFQAWEDEAPPREVIEAVLKEAAAMSGADQPVVAPVKSPSSAAAKPRQKTESVDLDDLLGEDSLESLEQDLKELENLVAEKKPPGGATEVDLSGADVYGQKAKKVPGKLSDDDREKLLRELGLDDESADAAQEEAGDGAPALEDMAKLADTAAKRKSRKMKKAEDEWDKIAGTTVFNKEDIAQVLGEKKQEAGKPAEGKTTDEWLALSGTGAFSAPPEKGSEADTLLGTTILSALPKT
ncbi:MAG: anti-sigma factor, partial [Planctomycetota bacterium]